MDSIEHNNLCNSFNLEIDGEMHYEVWTIDEVAEHINFLTKQLSGRVYELSSQAFKCLLDRYNWNVHQLSYDLMFKRKKVFENAKIKDPAKKSCKCIQKIKEKFKRCLEDNRKCKLCYETFVYDDFVEHCNHSYCKRCWSFWINNRYSRQDAMKCPENKCLVAYDTVMHYLKKSRIRFFQRLTISNFIRNDASYSWCPKIQSCSYIIKITDPKLKKVTCQCGIIFCFDCKKKWHTPITCQMLECWEEMRRKQVQSKNSIKCLKCSLIIRSTDECPRCSTALEDKQKLVSDNFYQFSTAYQFYRRVDDLPIYDKWAGLETLDEESEEVMKIVPIVSELREVYKCCIVFIYFLNNNNQHTDNFYSNFVLLKIIISNLAKNLIAFNTGGSEEIKENIRNIAKSGKSIAHILKSSCREGFRKGWWSFQDTDLNL